MFILDHIIVVFYCFHSKRALRLLTLTVSKKTIHSKCPYHAVIHTEEGQLAWLIQEICKCNEGICLFQIENENCCYEGHPLDLQREKNLMKMGL